eukprot:TRINITY_DN63653_c0_g1_i1.p1 TRINITY_DN63653_c0_g1~~TRINITY_DN63653_c0_g1_i1.p1  ORF type:complete len:760 (-),score=129.30 TRINITY_DN63653_c0_g1_i1:75-2354(-)
MPPKAKKPGASLAAKKAMMARLKQQQEDEEADKRAEEEQKKREEEERKKREEEAKIKAEKEAKAKEEAKRKQELIKAGKMETSSQKKKHNKDRAKIEAMLAARNCTVAGLSQEDKDRIAQQQSKREEEVRKAKEIQEQKKKEEEEKRRAYEEKMAMLKSQQDDNIRAPICCVLGHVDTGKTKLLDKIRRTNVQMGEAGGITQQIGASFFPIESILNKTAEINEGNAVTYQIPGLLIIDTPGHESFTNLRSRGSSLCDIAILVVDIMHGLEQQTKESIQLLRQRGTPFLVALNKIDRLYEWDTTPDGSSRLGLEKQKTHVKVEFDTRSRDIMDQLQREGLNSELYWKNDDLRKYVSVVPTSALTGEGIPDLLLWMVKLTQQHMTKKITKGTDLAATVLEVKVIEGLGYTIDVILVNGVLREGDTILIGGMNGPIQTQIRALLTPQPLKEMRVKGEYVHHKEIWAAQGVKISAQELEHAIAGSPLMVINDETEDADMERMLGEVSIENLLSHIKLQDRGVAVQASTLGSLEALLTFLGDECKPPIPVSMVNLGPIHKKDIVKARVMLDSPKPEFAVILAFDVPTTKDAQEMADKEGVRIFSANIIYHLFDQFTKYMEEVRADNKATHAVDAIFPCQLKIVKAFRAKDPIVLGVEVADGFLRPGTPLCCFPEDGPMLHVGKVASIENDHKELPELRKGKQAAIKVIPKESTLTVGRQFTEQDVLYSQITRDAIEALKAGFKDEMTKDDWKLVIKLKKRLKVF